MSTVEVASLAVSGVTKTFAGNVALDDVSLEVRPGEVHGLVGGNGSGKSTLIKILAGVHQADPGAGEIRMGDEVVAADRTSPEWARAAGLRFVHQDPAIVPALTVAENMALGAGFPTAAHVGIRWRELQRRMQALLDRYEIPLSARTPADRLGPAERTLVAIARAFVDRAALLAEHAGGGVLVLDEPTASLAAAEVAHLHAAIRRVAEAGTGVVYVSHRPGEVVSLCDRVSALRDGRVAGELAGDALGEDSVIELMVGRALALTPKEAPAPAGQDVVLEARGVACGTAVRGVDLALRRGEIVGIAGLVGCGSTELLELLFGARHADAGEVLLDGEALRLREVSDAIRAGIAYVPEDRAAHAAFGDMTVRENLTAAGVGRAWGGLRLSHRRERAEAERLVNHYGIVATSDAQVLSTLSGGNQQKVMLARWLRRDPRILLLDEPTQGVDVQARANIYEAIRAAVRAGASVIVASSDDDELAVLCDRVVVLHHGRVAGELAAPIDPDRLAELVMRAGEREPA